MCNSSWSILVINRNGDHRTVVVKPTEVQEARQAAEQKMTQLWQQKNIYSAMLLDPRGIIVDTFSHT